MQIKKIQQNKRITNVVKHKEIFTKCLLKICEKDFLINITICYEDYKDGENYLLYLMIQKLNPWDESYKDYMDIQSYVKNCIKKIYPNIDYERVSKQLMKFIKQIFDDNQIVNLWE